MSMGSDDLYAGARTGRWVGIAGIVAAVLFVPGLFLVAGDKPAYDASDADWVEWFAEDSNTTAAAIGALLLVVAALALIVFTAGLAARLRAAGGQRGNAVMLAGTGVATGAMIMVGGLTTAAISGAITFAPEFPAGLGAEDVYTAQAIEQIGFSILLVAGGWSAALLVALGSFSARRTAQLPTWLTTGGIVVAVLLLASITFLPLLLLPLWLLVTGIVLLMQGPASPVTPGPAGMR